MYYIFLLVTEWFSLTSLKSYRYYMPPECILKKQISNKNDIFSLGVIIIQIMSGPMGYAKFGEMPSTQQFMGLVRNCYFF